MLMIVKEFEFCCAHRLPQHKGACYRLHGHNYRLEIGITGPINDEGMIADFKQLKDLVNEHIIDKLDHYYLNDLNMAFPNDPDIKNFPADPTAENMVMWMAKALAPPLAKTGTELALIRLWETSTSYCEWRV